jgi:hypothetical protein
MNLKLTSILKEYSTGVVNKLKQKFKQENSNLTDQQIEYYINRFDQLKSSPKVEEKDITTYSFQRLEQVVDSFPTKEKVSKTNNNVEFSQTELIYNQAPLQIYHGSNERTCIKIKGDFPSSWCVSRGSGGNMYNTYRYAGTEPSFYFVKNLERLNKITKIEDDLYCFFVIQFNNEGKYIVTNAKNDGDREMSWDDILKIEPLLQGTESLFKNVPLTDEEKEYYRRFKDGISDEEYKDLSYKEKKIYIAITHELNDVKFKNTPNDLLNDYISMGVELTEEQFDFIKDIRQLFNNYRRVTIDIVLPEYLKGNINIFGKRWLVLTNDEAIDLYKKHQFELIQILRYKPQLIEKFEDILSNNNIADILSHQPQLIDKYEDKLNKFNSNQISAILKKQPQLIEKFEDKLYKLENNNIADILSKQPQLIGKFEDKLEDFDNANAAFIISRQPLLFKYFQDRLEYFDEKNIKTILSNQPYFIKYFEDKLHKLEDFDKRYVLSKHPQLKPYFEKQGLLKESLKYLSLRNILKR